MIKNKKLIYIIGFFVACCVIICVSLSIAGIVGMTSKPSVTNITAPSPSSSTDQDTDQTTDQTTNQTTNQETDQANNGSGDTLGSSYEYDYTTPGTSPDDSDGDDLPPLEATMYDKDDYEQEFGKFGPGDYPNLDNSQYGDISNDISSLKVPDGLEVHLYDKRNFEGEKWVFDKNTRDIGDAKNDASSMKVIDIR